MTSSRSERSSFPTSQKTALRTKAKKRVRQILGGRVHVRPGHGRQLYCVCGKTCSLLLRHEVCVTDHVLQAELGAAQGFSRLTNIRVSDPSHFGISNPGHVLVSVSYQLSD
jgi:hypothetical protein